MLKTLQAGNTLPVLLAIKVINISGLLWGGITRIQDCRDNQPQVYFFFGGILTIRSSH